jgi:hypothetical protein
MKKALLVSIAIIFAAGFIACQDEFGIRNGGEAKILKNPGAGSSPYFPYEVGKTWKYEGEYTFIQDTPEEVDTAWFYTSDSAEIIREAELTGSNPLEVWEISSIHILTQIVYGDTMVDTFYNTNYTRFEGDSAYIYEELGDSDPWYSFPAEPELGDEWDVSIEGSMGDTSTTHYEVIADDAEANGYSDCLKIESTPEDIEMYDEYETFDYWAWDVGSVMTTQYILMITDMGEDTLVSTFEGERKLITGAGIKE